MKKNIWFVCSFLLLGGCATMYQTEKVEPKKSFEEMVDIKLKQAIAIAETALEVSKNAEKLATEAVNTSNQAKANSEVAIKKVDEAIAATNEVKKFTEAEVQKAINSANEASEKAISKANEASEKAIKAANEASEKAIAVANQTIAEVNKLRATVVMKPSEPIIEEEPKSGKYYIIQKGDTLKKIAYKFYNDTSKWQLIYKVNKDIIKNPDALTPGKKIYIP